MGSEGEDKGEREREIEEEVEFEGGREGVVVFLLFVLYFLFNCYCD